MGSGERRTCNSGEPASVIRSVPVTEASIVFPRNARQNSPIIQLGARQVEPFERIRFLVGSPEAQNQEFVEAWFCVKQQPRFSLRCFLYWMPIAGRPVGRVGTVSFVA